MTRSRTGKDVTLANLGQSCSRQNGQPEAGCREPPAPSVLINVGQLKGVAEHEDRAWHAAEAFPSVEQRDCHAASQPRQSAAQDLGEDDGAVVVRVPGGVDEGERAVARHRNP